MTQKETGVNQQLAMTLFCTSIAFAICMFCSLTRVFLTGRLLGVLAFSPGVVLMMSAAIVCRRFDRGDKPRPWVKYCLCSVLGLSIFMLSLIQLVWCVPLVIGGLAFVYSYMNLRMVVIYNLLTLVFLFLGAAMNAAWGMPNPDMLPYPTDVQGIKDGYVTLWAMAHRDAWDHWGYFLRILRFHTLPVVFLLMIVGGCGYAMVANSKRRLLESLERSRRIREVEGSLLLMVSGNQSEELINAVMRTEELSTAPMPPLSPEFVASIPAESIPALMRTFRHRCEEDSTFVDLAARNPEAALKSIL